MPKANNGLTDRFSTPLCCNYLLAVFQDVHIKVSQEGGGVSSHAMRWGLGALSDGQLELLGAWHRGGTDESLWAQVSKDLKLRGVEEIRFIAGLESLTGFERAAQALCLDADALPLSGQLFQQVETELRAKDRHTASDSLASLYRASTPERAEAALSKFADGPVGVQCPELVERFRLAIQQLSPFYTSAPRIRRVVRNADAASRQLTLTMLQAIRRHGCFPSVEAATTFVAEALIRAEARLSAFAPSPAAGPMYRAAAMGTRFSISAAGL